MKKINRKGFTLIELLAVIVILAIILVVTVPNIINSINDARVSSLHNLAVSTANTYDNLVAQDLIATNKTLGDIPSKLQGKGLKCIKELTNDTTGKNLAEILGLSENDLILDGSAVQTATGCLKENRKDCCSAIRVDSNGKTMIFLNAKDGGRFAVSGKDVIAYSNSGGKIFSPIQPN